MGRNAPKFVFSLLREQRHLFNRKRFCAWLRAVIQDDGFKHGVAVLLACANMIKMFPRENEKLLGVLLQRRFDTIFIAVPSGKDQARFRAFQQGI